MSASALCTWAPVSEAPCPVHEARGAHVQAHDSPIPSEEQWRFRLFPLQTLALNNQVSHQLQQSEN
jgi:hypothetical protein